MLRNNEYIMACRLYDQISSVVNLVSGQVPFLEFGNFIYLPHMLLHRPYPAHRPQSPYSPAVLHKRWWHITPNTHTCWLESTPFTPQNCSVKQDTLMEKKFLSHCPHSFISKNVKTQTSMRNWLQTTSPIKKAIVKWDQMERSQQGTLYNQYNMTTGPVSGQYMRKSTGFYITITFFLNFSTHCSKDHKFYYSVLLLVSCILQNYYLYHIFCKTYILVLS